MIPAVVRLDLVDKMLCLPEKLRICLERRRPPYGTKIEMIMINDRHELIPVGGLMETKVGT